MAVQSRESSRGVPSDARDGRFCHRGLPSCLTRGHAPTTPSDDDQSNRMLSMSRMGPKRAATSATARSAMRVSGSSVSGSQTAT